MKRIRESKEILVRKGHGQEPLLNAREPLLNLRDHWALRRYCLRYQKFHLQNPNNWYPQLLEMCPSIILDTRDGMCITCFYFQVKQAWAGSVHIFILNEMYTLQIIVWHSKFKQFRQTKYNFEFNFSYVL